MSSDNSTLFVHVILPILIEKEYTYRVPEHFRDRIKFGIRVEVQFGAKKRYAGLVVGQSTIAPEYRTKEILDIVDDVSIIQKWQYEMWHWMADYYSCSLGEVTNAALPAGLKLSSESIFILQHEDEDVLADLSDQEYMIYQALKNGKELKTEDIQKILNRKSIYPVIHQMFRKGLVMVKEELLEKYAPKIVHLVSLTSYFASDPEKLTEAFDLIMRSEHQTRALLAFMQQNPKYKPVDRKKLLKQADVSHSVIAAMEKKGIFQVEGMQINRFDVDGIDLELPNISLTSAQEKAAKQIRQHWSERKVALLHGVTGSGKTLIYNQLIKETIERGEQALFLLPEIALSVQVIARLRKEFGEQVIVSHSKLTNNERVDLWKRVSEGLPVILGVRSSIFLPFQNLGLIIVDEEHDASFKQHDPAPRYQARDVAIYIGHKFGANILLGTATPSMESYHNAQNGKYGLVQLSQRYQSIEMPEIELIDLRYTKGVADRQISNELLDAIQKTLEKEQQVIIFKNRRGYSPTLRCNRCSWHSECKNCDISLTYHKYKNNLHCHLCGYKTYVPHKCPSCGSDELVLEGYGTQKIEDELEVQFPDANVKRMDYDTTRKKHGHERLIEAFENQEIQILVGTQMVTKGLDFDHVGLVGVIHGDQQLFFPDFRAAERTFQLMVQVSGRAGRKHERGRVLIQTFHPDHPIFSDIKQSDYASFFEREALERRRFKYPPYFRLIKLTVSHQKLDTSRYAAYELAKWLKGKLGDRVIGPAEPQIARVRDKYLFDIGIKLEKQPEAIRTAKLFIQAMISRMKKLKGMSNVRVRVDVDP